MLQVVVSGEEDVRQVELLTHHGNKYSPPNGSKVAIINIGRAWKTAVACDDKLAPDVQPGERRSYSTDSGGAARVTEIYFKNDGTLVISANTKVTVEAPDIEATADNSIVADASDIEATASNEIAATAPNITLNGNVQLNGALTATGTVTAPNVVGSTDVSFGGISGTAHTHNENGDGGGVTDPPNT
jgi:phage gp45-like